MESLQFAIITLNLNKFVKKEKKKKNGKERGTSRSTNVLPIEKKTHFKKLL